MALPMIDTLTFPEKGLDVTSAYALQREGTTPIAQNVRLFEPGTDRARGGSRPGLRSFVDQQLPLP